MAIEPEAVIGDPERGRPAWPAPGPAGSARGPAGFDPGPAGFSPGGALGAGSARATRQTSPGRGKALAVVALLIGGAGVILAGIQVHAGLSPRKFTSAQRQQILAWEVAGRWRELPAGVIFPAAATYPPPSQLQDGGPLALAAQRLGIARGVPCQQAADPAAAAILDASGCQGLLRASYIDETGSFVVTLGVAAFPSAAQGKTASRALGPLRPADAGHPDALVPGVRTATFASTPAAAFTDKKRQVSGSISAGPYIIMYTIGYADNRPKVPVDVDGYTYAEMTSMGQGLARAIAHELTLPPPVPRCPGAPGC